MARLKRLVAPKFWPIERKTKKFSIATKPGPHPKEMCMPLGMIVRDILNYARTLKEAKNILRSGNVSVDDVVRKDHNFPVGLMDVIKIGEDCYRLLPNNKGLYLQRIDTNESGIKLLKIRNKKNVPGGKTQLNMHDGRNIIISNDSKNLKTGDVVVFDLKKKSIIEQLRLKKGSLAIITGGHNIGCIGRVENIITTKNPQPNQVVVKIGEKSIMMPKNYAFAIGEDKPIILI